MRTSPLIDSLTKGERATLELVACGYSNTAIAFILGVETKTIENRVTSIVDKFEVRHADHSPRVVLALVARGIW